MQRNTTPRTTASYTTTSKPWTCADCRVKLERRRPRVGELVTQSRPFSRSARLHDEKRNDTAAPISQPETSPPSPTIRPDKPEPSPVPNTPASTSTTLPSRTESARSDLSKRMSKLMDDLLARASVASQHINAYTGTDFSGIEALRKEISDQEQKVRSYRREVDDTKSSHHDAHAKQTNAQREIVGLLERKASWSPSDLERYMSLVRSEHLNERDVQIAKENLATAERNLEDARSLLERLERKQYHEEQIWSDTIRRNSTWVTFGLMGVNILLLLTQIAVFEPNRRKKIVRDVKAALDERTLSVSPVGETPAETGVVLTTPVSSKKSEDIPLAVEKVLPPEASDFVGAVPAAIETAPPTAPSELPVELPEVAASKPAPSTTMEIYQEILHDLFSERLIQIKKVDLTNAALQGAASGVALMGFLFLLFRPK
ncbi:mitochondrial distribution and morphology family 33, fungi [Zymoseptoria tritici IPO323]|uniref:Sensitive to high expression protein 9, mitochondrial n=1 Tax=Zymoseptoria tritici (strain CBS 115943 / IPO323) TaxID=336722 RepID=F9XJ40_ZYMTI|nr:mitochondrial distribution and morphology family 33, fungi [Zymoseptoria tritici IPO323]EGP84783.1 mitochondrial distribution and morphology family 33, fungi [Zymoseptoria tritici IPO323]